jgi:hypothetical protein
VIPLLIIPRTELSIPRTELSLILTKSLGWI